MFVLKNTANLFGADWLALFDLWDLSVNSFCNKINIVTASVKSVTKKLKNESNEFPMSLLRKSGHVRKIKAKFELKENVRKLEKLGMISKIDTSEWG